MNEYGYVRNGAKITPYKNIVSPRGYAEKIFNFPEGLPGFEDNKEFSFCFTEKSNPFLLMNFCGEKTLSFVCLDPFFLKPDYQPNIRGDDKYVLNAISDEDASNLVFLAIVKLSKDNIKNGLFSDGVLLIGSPIAVNYKNNFAKQIILKDKYPESLNFTNISKFTIDC